MKPLLPPVTVNGVVIARERIAAEAQNHPAPPGKPGHAWKAAARALALRELLLQKARAQGLEPTPGEIAPGQIETPEEALVRQVLEAEVQPVPASDAELRDVYQARPDRFRAPALYEAAHILFAATPSDASGRTAARAQAEKVMAVLRERPIRFAELAASYSSCASKSSGGLLGQLSAGDIVPEFEAAMRRLEPGALTLVETRYGIHVLRLNARAEGAVLPFEAVLPRLRDAHAKTAWLNASRDFIAILISRAAITGAVMSQ